MSAPPCAFAMCHQALTHTYRHTDMKPIYQLKVTDL